MISNLRRFIVRYRYVLSGALVLLLALGGYLIWRAAQKPPSIGHTIPIQGGSTSQTGGITTLANAVSLVSIRLSEGKAHPQTAVSIPLATGDPLTPEEIQRILSRLPDLPVDPSTQVEFKLPTAPIPPPRTGETIKQTFPPEESAVPPEVASGPLEVLRYSPQGEI